MISYDLNASTEAIRPGRSMAVNRDDQPSAPFHRHYRGSTAPGIHGWHAVAVAGSMTFTTWLIRTTLAR